MRNGNRMNGGSTRAEKQQEEAEGAGVAWKQTEREKHQEESECERHQREKHHRDLCASVSR